MLFGKGGNKHFHGPDEPAGYDKWEVKDEDKDRKDIVRPPVGTFALRKRFRVKATSFLDGKRAVECKTKEKPFKLRVRASGERSDGQYCEFECFSDPFYVVADRESLYRMVKRGKNKARRRPPRRPPPRRRRTRRWPTPAGRRRRRARGSATGTGTGTGRVGGGRVARRSNTHDS